MRILIVGAGDIGLQLAKRLVIERHDIAMIEHDPHKVKRAKEQVNRSLNYAYRDRRTKKRDFRRLWIARINAAARENGLAYRELMHGLGKEGRIVAVPGVHRELRALTP